MAEDSSEFTELRDYIPPGMELRETSSYGRALYATRDFKKFDVVLVETPTLMVLEQLEIYMHTFSCRALNANSCLIVFFRTIVKIPRFSAQCKHC